LRDSFPQVIGKPVENLRLVLSGEDVTVDEIFGHFVVTNIPLKVLLKDTISDTIAEGID
jgi:hypothetical protein